jgi:hypothetical protein
MLGRKFVACVIVGLAVAGTARADVMPFQTSKTQLSEEPALCCRSEQRAVLGPFLDPSARATADSARRDLYGIADGSQLGINSEPVHVLTEGSDSFGLCLYALLGLGLCKSAPWLRKLSLGPIPDWYHDGGPFQIGHSVALSPQCSCDSLICFVQPQGSCDDPLPQYQRQTLFCLWRRSQSIPAADAPRGPPSRSHESSSLTLSCMF